MNGEGRIRLPPHIRVLRPRVPPANQGNAADPAVLPTQRLFVDHCYWGIANRRIDLQDPAMLQYFSERSILATKKLDVDDINATVLEFSTPQTLFPDSMKSVIRVPKSHCRS
jgi:hypothetical protein